MSSRMDCEVDPGNRPPLKVASGSGLGAIDFELGLHARTRLTRCLYQTKPLQEQALEG